MSKDTDQKVADLDARVRKLEALIAQPLKSVPANVAFEMSADSLPPRETLKLKRG